MGHWNVQCETDPCGSAGGSFVEEVGVFSEFGAGLRRCSKDAPGYPHDRRWGNEVCHVSGVRNDRVMVLEWMLSTSVDKAVNSCKSLIYEC